jgi:predicted metal-dependent enzyme (double-stranded beta helix superfamily)
MSDGGNSLPDSSGSIEQMFEIAFMAYTLVSVNDTFSAASGRCVDTQHSHGFGTVPCASARRTQSGLCCAIEALWSPTMSNPPQLARLRDFVQALACLLARQPGEPEILAQAGALLAQLVAHDDWLPDDYARPDAQRYQQYLLYADALERFSVVSFVWGPGQATPIHDHTVWGLIGVLRGAELEQPYVQAGAGAWQPQGAPRTLRPGQVHAVSPTVGDVHRVSNAHADRTSISIHVYGANIGAVQRSVFLEEGTRKRFVSGYSNTRLPNLWDRSIELNASLQAQS